MKSILFAVPIQFFLYASLAARPVFDSRGVQLSRQQSLLWLFGLLRVTAPTATLFKLGIEPPSGRATNSFASLLEE